MILRYLQNTRHQRNFTLDFSQYKWLLFYGKMVSYLKNVRVKTHISMTADTLLRYLIYFKNIQ